MIGENKELKTVKGIGLGNMKRMLLIHTVRIIMNGQSRVLRSSAMLTINAM